MERSIAGLIAVALALPACNSSPPAEEPRPPVATPPTPPEPPPARDPVADWARAARATSLLAPGSKLPAEVVRALHALVPPQMAPYAILWAKPLVDGAELIAFAAGREGKDERGNLEGRVFYALASYSGGKFSVVGSQTEDWLLVAPEYSELGTRDLDGDGIGDLMLNGNWQGPYTRTIDVVLVLTGDRSVKRLRYFQFGGENHLAREYSPMHVCLGRVGGKLVFADVHRIRETGDAGERTVEGLFVLVPDADGFMRPAEVWGHEVARNAKADALMPAWQKLAGAEAVFAAKVDDHQFLTSLPDCAEGVPLIVAAAAVTDAKGKPVARGGYHLVHGLSLDQADAAAKAGGKKLVRLGKP